MAKDLEQLGGVRGVVAGAGAAFVSTLASRWLIGQVERNRSLTPYAAYRLGLAGAVVAQLWRAARVARRGRGARVARRTR